MKCLALSAAENLLLSWISNVNHLQRKPYGPGDTRPTPRHPEGGDSAHIFAYADGEIEVSKDFLNRLLTYFEKNSEEREELRR